MKTGIVVTKLPCLFCTGIFQNQGSHCNYQVREEETKRQLYELMWKGGSLWFFAGSLWLFAGSLKFFTGSLWLLPVLIIAIFISSWKGQ